MGFPGPEHGPHHGPPRGHALSFLLFDYKLYLFIIVFFVSLLAKISQKWKKTEKEKLNAELLFLKAQINPHFLFNTLNSIYSLAIDKSDYTPTAIVKLSGMMRYVISEASGDLVTLEKEINYISDYIELQRLRLGDTVNLHYKVEGLSAGKKIAPLLLMPAIENAFKHGVNPEENSDISVRITIREYSLELCVRNRKVTHAGSDEPSGLGLTNTRNRLNLMYASRHEFQIRDNDQEFVVSLVISFR
jgi:sensor histidine kinase YesM